MCQNTADVTGSVLLDDRNRGCSPEVQHTLMDMRLNASRMRDTARVLRSSTDPVLSERRKQETALDSVNSALRCPLPQHAAAAGHSGSQLGIARLSAVWACRLGWGRLKPHRFLGAKIGAKPYLFITTWKV